MSDVRERLGALRIVPVLTIGDADQAERACDALLAGGLSVVEITFRTDAAAVAIERVAAKSDLLVGAGTVLTPDRLARAIDAGARFAVAPGTNEAVIDAARSAGLPFIPGVATPSEIERAHALGCRVQKLFPASVVGGTSFIKAVAPVYPDVVFVPTGGVNLENLTSYLGLPNVLAVGGSWICERSLVEGKQFGEIERRAREAVELASIALAA